MNNSYCQWCTNTDISPLPLSRWITLSCRATQRYSLCVVSNCEPIRLHPIIYLPRRVSRGWVIFRETSRGFLECRHGNSEASRNSWKRYCCLSLSLSLDCCPWCYWLVILRDDKNVLETRQTGDVQQQECTLCIVKRIYIWLSSVLIKNDKVTD